MYHISAQADNFQFVAQINQIRYFQPKKIKIKITIEVCIFELV